MSRAVDRGLARAAFLPSVYSVGVVGVPGLTGDRVEWTPYGADTGWLTYLDPVANVRRAWDYWSEKGVEGGLKEAADTTLSTVAPDYYQKLKEEEDRDRRRRRNWIIAGVAGGVLVLGGASYYGWRRWRPLRIRIVGP
jgi:hypothetical protein